MGMYMNIFNQLTARFRHHQPLWDDREPIREELFGIERLEQHALSLAKAQQVTDKPVSVLSLPQRLEQNARTLLRVYGDCVADIEAGKEMVPAAEWLLDNYHLVEAQIREIREDLPVGYYQQLPKLASGPFAGYPRVFGLAWAFIAHTDSHLDPNTLSLFIDAYQRVQPLTIGELWAVAITLRIVLIENLCRLGEQITREQVRRDEANQLADQLLNGDSAQATLAEYIRKHQGQRLSETFAAQLVSRLRTLDPVTTPALGWLETRLAERKLSVDVIVEHIQQRQGAANVTIRNVITSMRLISDIDWATLFERVSLVDAELRAQSDFAAMDFATRNLYRNAIEELSRHSDLSELQIARQLLVSTKQGIDPGFYLIGQHRPAFEQTIGFRPPLRLRLSRSIGHLSIGGFVGLVIMAAAILLIAALAFIYNSTFSPAFSPSAGWSILFITIAFLPATDIAMALISRLVVWVFNPTILPGMELKEGVPDNRRTLVAVPTLLTSQSDIEELTERLEVHYLSTISSGATENISFALLTDWVDSEAECNDEDKKLLTIAKDSITSLNRKYGGQKFWLLHRRRVFNQSENIWMGWERKRGKLHELNQLLRGSTDTTFIQTDTTQLPADVRYVITLDSDTRVTRDTILRLIGKMAHPLNQPSFDASQGRITQGYGILQPRVTPTLPIGHQGSIFQRIVSGPGGIDPYAAAASDIYQDLFHEGSYTGKGIYDIDAYEAALRDRIPDNILLSHDLFEGIYARAGLASDIEVMEDFPVSYDVAVKRQHRWTRGDWQLLSWVLSLRTSVPQTGSQAVPLLGRFKMLDNLRRSLIAPFILAALTLCWFLPLPLAVAATCFVLSSIALPAFMPVLCNIGLPRNRSLRNHIHILLADTKLAFVQTLLSISVLPDQAVRTADAISRTLVRLFITHHHLLEWTPAALLAARPCRTLTSFYKDMKLGIWLASGLLLGTLIWQPHVWPLLLIFALLWFSGPALVFWTSTTPPVTAHSINSDDAQSLRLIARRTWRFFERSVTPEDNMLPPDNLQENPQEIIAHRTSPTNIGVYLLSAITARDFGWAGTLETIERMQATFDSMQKLQRFKGHFLNWYSTQQLTALTPAYVSSVDSGNLAGHLLVMANTCEEWLYTDKLPDYSAGLTDNCQLAQSALEPIHSADKNALHTIFQRLADSQATHQQRLTLADNALALAQRIDTKSNPATDELLFWISAIQRRLQQHTRDCQYLEDGGSLRIQLRHLANAARQMALGMDFKFLLDPRRKLLSIGYSLETNSRDDSCYDLLASEARLASLFAIAKGDAETKHWFRLGRSATPVYNGSALISWSGSMFEYLMPSMVMHEPSGSLLCQTTELAVRLQQTYAKSLNIPWGMSESAFNARDHEFTYQYASFGVPELGLKRGLRADKVVAPYATGLATMIDPAAALTNYIRLEEFGALGRYGYYEALDFTPGRVPDKKPYAIVRSFMAHHQGMTIIAIANTLQHGIMRQRFHREPIIKSCELLLQERMPRDIVAPHQLAIAVNKPLFSASAKNTTRRSFRKEGPLQTHVLANGRYSVMLTTTGSGYSRWRDMAITRWHEDANGTPCGTLIFLRDMQNNQCWSATAPLHPQIKTQPQNESMIEFAEDHADFVQHHNNLTTTMEVVVSMEDDGEVRRVSLTNLDSKTRNIELTSYAEIVLNTPGADNAHPAFSKMFVQTEYLAEFDAIIATRRPRASTDAPIWAAHCVVVEGELAGSPQFESDRAKFLGRGRNITDAASMQPGEDLSNTAGTVLDPVFSLRRQVKVHPGEVVRVAFWTLVADSRQDLLNLLDKHHDRNAFERAKTLAWTQAQVQLRHLSIEKKEAVDFQRLATPLLYPDNKFRASAELIRQGANCQSALWETGISGDRPIVLLYVNDMKDITRVKQLLRAHEYWRLKHLCVDLVIMNEQPSSYVQQLQDAIESAVRGGQPQPELVEQRLGTVYTLRADQVSLHARALLVSACRVFLHAKDGPLRAQLATRQSPLQTTPVTSVASSSTKLSVHYATPDTSHQLIKELEFFNGLGGFANNGTEYVTILKDNQTTPAPWINVVANPEFGFHTSADGSAYTWAANSRENQLTAWSNDAVSDPSGEAFYIRDEDSLAVFSPTAHCVRDQGTYISRHGFGYSRFEHHTQGIALQLLQFVPLQDPIKISRLTLKNTSEKARTLSVTGYVEWVLGNTRARNAAFIETGLDPVSGALIARNPWSIDFSQRVAFADLIFDSPTKPDNQQTQWTCDRSEFLGPDNHNVPLALTSRKPLSGRAGVGLDPCAALQCQIKLAPGESTEITFFIGQGASHAESRTLLAHYRKADLNAMFSEVSRYWQSVLKTVQVKTPDRSMDIMLNGWLLYQTLVCRIRARSAFYQASGAYGFRDQLQDGMALTFAQPAETRAHILRAAGRQFAQGDVQHWWLPQSGTGVRTRISDDRVWLVYATAKYIQSSGDSRILDEQLPFLDGPELADGQHENVFKPTHSEHTASLFEHCARALEQAIQLTGKHGLPLIGTGDWNDGMNNVGAKGQGESVWLGWLLLKTITLFAAQVAPRDPDRAKVWTHHAQALRDAIEQVSWDGEWYRRATYDDGSWLGSWQNEECRIDSIAQSWAVLSGGADPARAHHAMSSLSKQLIQPDPGLVLLFTPPFDHNAKYPGYIQGYPPGLRENGGQYSHAAMWVVEAFAELGDGNKAVELLHMLNPINHALTYDDMQTYKVEPYVMAADIYSVAPHAGRGGWTWYTGAAACMYRAGLESLLGLQRRGDMLVIKPCISRDWPGYQIEVNVDGSRYQILVSNPQKRCQGIASAELDSMPVEHDELSVQVPLDGKLHTLRITL